MEYNALMKELGDNLGIEDFAPESSGFYCLNINDDVVFFIDVPESGLLEIVARICEVPTKGSDLFAMTLLSAMAPGNAAENYNFFVTEDQNLYLRHSEALDSLNGISLRQSLENFANALDEWRSSLNNLQNVLPAISESTNSPENENSQFDLNNNGFLQV